MIAHNPMRPRFETLEKKKLIGMKERMSLTSNKTFQLFSTFMPRRHEIITPKNGDVYDLKIYPEDYYENFNPAREFEKWALMEVNVFDQVPLEMDTFELPAGIYAVFIQRGPNSDTSTFEHIFREWLPTSGYKLDNRPHFEILGPKYRKDHIDSEEEIWIPVKR
ncbi:MAG: GyrI-like domain-containing protein [Cyclobacteriaceae bacterium]|nr:GyrI-like domain-containing protein [Cyclobacteriaceae bacterium]